MPNKLTGPYIDIDLGACVVRLLKLDYDEKPTDIVYVRSINRGGQHASSYTYRYSFTKTALWRTIDWLEAWDGTPVGEDTPHGTRRAVNEFLRKAYAALEKQD